MLLKAAAEQLYLSEGLTTLGYVYTQAFQASPEASPLPLPVNQVNAARFAAAAACESASAPRRCPPRGA